MVAQVEPFLFWAVTEQGILSHMIWIDEVGRHNIPYTIHTWGIADSKRPVIHRSFQRFPDASSFHQHSLWKLQRSSTEKFTWSIGNDSSERRQPSLPPGFQLPDTFLQMSHLQILLILVLWANISCYFGVLYQYGPRWLADHFHTVRLFWLEREDLVFEAKY